MEEKRKSRSIPLQEYISRLQLEYLSYFIRSKIFEQPFNEKYSEFCKKKKETIEGFSLKNGRPCIFNDDNIRNKYIKEFFGDGFGLPLFQYRDEYQKQNIGFYDKKYYFPEGIIVMYNNEEYTIHKNICRRSEEFEDSILIKKDEKSPWIKVPIKLVMRKDYLNLF